jgi:hypothetical protein
LRSLESGELLLVSEEGKMALALQKAQSAKTGV